MRKICSAVVKRICEQLAICPFGLELESGDLSISLSNEHLVEPVRSAVTRGTPVTPLTMPRQYLEAVLFSKELTARVSDRFSLRSVTMLGFVPYVPDDSPRPVNRARTYRFEIAVGLTVTLHLTSAEALKPPKFDVPFFRWYLSQPSASYSSSAKPFQLETLLRAERRFDISFPDEAKMLLINVAHPDFFNWNRAVDSNTVNYYTRLMGLLEANLLEHLACGFWVREWEETFLMLSCDKPDLKAKTIWGHAALRKLIPITDNVFCFALHGNERRKMWKDLGLLHCLLNVYLLGDTHGIIVNYLSLLVGPSLLRAPTTFFISISSYVPYDEEGEMFFDLRDIMAFGVNAATFLMRYDELASFQECMPDEDYKALKEFVFWKDCIN